MELTNDFRVEVSVAEAWKLLTDVERMAPLLPGAQLHEIAGDEFRGRFEVKLGPITAHYRGFAAFVERDEKAGRVVLKAEGREGMGQGNASAVITATLVADGDATAVTVVTDLAVTGAVAQLGRGVLAAVADKVVGQFAEDLGSGLAREESECTVAPDSETPDIDPSDPNPSASADASTDDGEGAEAAAPKEPTGADAGGDDAGGDDTGDADETGHTHSHEPGGLLQSANLSMAKRAAPVAGGVVVVLLLLVLRRRRARRRAQRYAAGLAALRQLRGRVPEMRLPEVRLPDLHLSDLPRPDLHLRDLPRPDLHLPEVHRPDIHLADLQKLARRGR